MLGHLLALKGIAYVGVDPDPALLDVALQVTSKSDYPGEKPAYFLQENRKVIPLPEASVDAVLLLNVLEKHPNPVGLLREVRRVLQPEGLLAISLTERALADASETDCLHAYRAHELIMQIRNLGCFMIITPPLAGTGELKLVARCLPRPGSIREIKQDAWEMDDVPLETEGMNLPRSR